MATHSSILAWRIPGMAEPGGLPSVGSHKLWGRTRLKQLSSSRPEGKGLGASYLGLAGHADRSLLWEGAISCEDLLMPLILRVSNRARVVNLQFCPSSSRAQPPASASGPWCKMWHWEDSACAPFLCVGAQSW